MSDWEVHFPEWDTSSPAKQGAKGTNKTLKELTKLLEESIVLNMNTLGSINQLAVRKHFSDWLKRGISPETIREMIRIFTTDTTYLRGNGPVWQRFLWHRDTLLQRAEATTPPTNW